jgi:EAL domain-containing protein (putative c-di-GMP-specific phosphodiesterase class I)
MGCTLKMKVVAERVERAEDAEFLNARASDEAQRFYFGRPITAEQFAGMQTS